MSDYAASFLAALKASSNKSATGRNLLTIFGAGSGGALGQADFQRVFAEMALGRPTGVVSQGATQPTSFNMQRTIFECQLYPSFSNHYASAKYQATEMLQALDSNADGSVSLAEMAAYDTSPPTPTPPPPTPPATDSGASPSTDPTTTPSAPSYIAMSLTTVASIAEGASAATFASKMLKSFDVAGKGYFTANDVQAAFTADPVLGDPAKAHSIVAELDGNGDGQVTQQELVASFQRLDIASNLMSVFDPANAGYIDLASLTGPAAAVSPALTTMLKSWDADSDGHLTSAEVLAGLKASPLPLDEMSTLVNAVNASLTAQDAMGQYDATSKGYITAADLAAGWAGQGAPDPIAARNAVAAWDGDGDGQVNLGEMVSGQQVTDVANQLLAQFDPGAQGYIDMSASAAASMGMAPNLFNVLKSWDADNSGRLTRQEILKGIQASNIKYQVNAKPNAAPSPKDAGAQALSIMSQVDTNTDGQINLGEFLNFAGSDAAMSSDPVTTFNAWDGNKDGYLSLDEMQTGIQTIQQAQSIVSQYDTTSKGYFDAADLESALTSIDPTQSPADVAAQARQIMNFWDANGDGQVTVQEVIEGIKSGGYVGGQQVETKPPGA